MHSLSVYNIILSCLENEIASRVLYKVNKTKIILVFRTVYDVRNKLFIISLHNKMSFFLGQRIDLLRVCCKIMNSKSIYYTCPIHNQK